jgi:hypothetical protein
VFGDARRAVVVGGLVVFAAGLAIGFVVGRSGRDELRATEPVATSTSAAPSVSAGATSPPVVVTPDPGQAPAISQSAQILTEGDRPVVSATAAAPCQALVTPGLLGECGSVPVAGSPVVWVVQRSATSAGTTAIEVRIFSYVPDAGGWVEWLRASDPAGERWSDVTVLAADLTADGLAELLVGYRGTDELTTLEYDIVGYTQARLPEVLAHPQPSARGAVVVTGGQIQEYAAQYPNDEPACCPPSFLRRTIAFDEGFFREIASETVPANTVPASLL